MFQTYTEVSCRVQVAEITCPSAALYALKKHLVDHQYLQTKLLMFYYDIN